MKEKLLISFSGGETSAFMTQWLYRHKQDEYDIKIVFANTGQENEQTLEFVQKCSEYFDFHVVWVEAKVNHNERVGTSFKIVDFKTASRKGEPFEQVIMKYGIPNMATPHCTRELKQSPINAYAKSVWGNDYYTAIGIRKDEFDRMNEKYKEFKLLYPLISMQPMTKPMINFFWKQMPFRLELKGYQGNCKWCWKKGFGKLYQIANEDVANFEFPLRMESEYGTYIPQSRLDLMKERGVNPFLTDGKLIGYKTINEGEDDEYTVPVYEEVYKPITFFRKKTSAKQIIEDAGNFKGVVINDSENYTIQQDLFDNTDLMGGESCEVYSECGS